MNKKEYSIKDASQILKVDRKKLGDFLRKNNLKRIKYTGRSTVIPEERLTELFTYFRNLEYCEELIKFYKS